MNAFSCFVSRKLEGKEDYNYRAVFAIIETLLVKGDDDVSLAVSLQFLENLLNFSSHGDYPVDSFIDYLGKKSKEFCKANEEFWGIKDSKF